MQGKRGWEGFEVWSGDRRFVEYVGHCLCFTGFFEARMVPILTVHSSRSFVFNKIFQPIRLIESHGAHRHIPLQIRTDGRKEDTALISNHCSALGMFSQRARQTVHGRRSLRSVSSRRRALPNPRGWCRCLVTS
jgi:hypothetical protein